MSKLMPGHPGEERLLRLADGELTPRQSAGVRDHLEACWECRAEMESIQGAVADCVHYRKSVLQAHLPAAPAPWRDLSAGFAAVDREIAAESSWWRHLGQALAAPRFWVPALVAGLMVMFVLAPWLRVTPSVQAAELLHRAVAAAQNRPVLAGKNARRLQVRTKAKNMAYSPGAVELRPLAALFEAAQYDWTNPLSAKSYLDWHARQAVKTDEVVPQGDAFFQVITRSGEGELAEGSLRLRQSDLQPVQGLFRFRNGEWVEVTEVEAATVAPAGPVSAASPSVAPSTPPQAVIAEATLSDELRVFEALHRAGADLGDPLEVRRSGSIVEVKGFGIDPRRRAQIEQALQPLPRVGVRFVDEPPPASLLAEPAPGALAVRSAQSPLQSLLEEKLGGRAMIEQFGNEVFDRYELIMGRAHAIDRLASRFANSSAILTAADVATYRSLQRSHAQALMQLERELAAILRPILLSSSSVVSGSGQPAAAGLSTGQSILQFARRLERSVSMLLGAAPLSGIDPSTLPSRIAGDQAALEQSTRNYLESMGQ